MDHGSASVNNMMEGDAGCIAGSERSIRLTLSKEREDIEL
jgi:hypothetical protein